MWFAGLITMTDENYSDADLIRILNTTKTIALVGASQKPERPSNGVMQFLLQRGYQVIPVNPGLAGGFIHGQLVHKNLADIWHGVDMVNVFRNSNALSALVDEIMGLQKPPKYIWTQLGVYDLGSAARARRAGIEVVMNRCPAIEIPRLGCVVI